MPAAAISSPDTWNVERRFLPALARSARHASLRLDGTPPPDITFVTLPAALRDAVPLRRLQFRAGRYCAMKAMEALDPSYAGQSVGRGRSGIPLWPAGVVGSITHTDDYAAAAVALSVDVASLGIDTERVMTESRARNVAGAIAWPSEVAHARTAGLSPLEAMTLVFSAKESIFKCLHPLVGRYFDFRDVRIIAVDGPGRAFTARLTTTLSDVFPSMTLLQGAFDLESHRIHTGVALPATFVSLRAFA